MIRRVRSSALAWRAAASICSWLLLASTPGYAQSPDPNADPAAPAPPAADSTYTDTLDAAESDGDAPRRQLISWNEYEGPYFSIRVGGGLLYDYADFYQDDDSEAQADWNDKADLRDFRFVFKGKLFVSRLTYTLGYMYDKALGDWRFRQTGLMLAVPELLGSIFVGRTKEGFSTSKIMVGYQGWTAERAAINDALLPILADGVKWTGGIPSGKFVYNLGYFTDTLSEKESFNKNDEQFVARGVWIPFHGTDKGLVHLAVQARYADANDGFLQYRSRPEAFQAQSYAIDTGRFPAQDATAVGLEAYYRPGPLMFGMEYYFNMVSSNQMNDPFFHGGEIFVAYLVTGETRPYNTRGAYFERVSPTKTVFEGGTGALELVLRASYADLDSKLIQGGKFWRITPVINWHLSDNIRVEWTSGYSVLDRFGVKGGAAYFHTRIQFQL